MPTPADILLPFPATLEIDVAWGEMDAAQHVNNAVYLRYFESARLAYFRLVGFDGFAGGVDPILAAITCQYKMPLTYPDRVTAGARLLRGSLTDTSFDMQQIVVGHAAGRVAAVGTASIVCYDYGTRQRAPLPADLRAHLLATVVP